MTFKWQDVLDGDGNFNVPSDMWKAMNACMTQDEIIDLFQDAVDNTRMLFPFRDITEEQAVWDFLKLKYLNTSVFEIPGEWKTVTDYDYKYGFRGVSIEQSLVGLLSSNHFHQKYRYECDNNTRNAGAVAWNVRRTRREIFKPLWTLDMKQVTPREIRTCCAMRTYVAAQFRPSMAKYMYDHYAGKGGRVLDFSAGWGDRLSAALACDKVTCYTGIDPNTSLHPGYQKQIATFNQDLEIKVDETLVTTKSLFVPKTVTMIHGPAEDVDIPGEYDLVFTSPPYFDKEYYSKESTQSWIRYKSIEAWLQGFMFPVLRKVWERLVPGGVLAVNIVDTKNFNPSRRIVICDPMNDCIAGLPGAEYLGAIGMRMSVRPNLLGKKTTDGQVVEQAAKTDDPVDDPSDESVFGGSMEDFLLRGRVAAEKEAREKAAFRAAAEAKEAEKQARTATCEPVWMWKKT